MKLAPRNYIFVAAVASGNWLALGQEMKKLVISYQSQMGGVLYFLARDRGYFKDMGLDVEMIRYPSGAPQIKDAIANKTWDVGEAGVVPNILGGPQGILGIGISQDQSATNQLVGNAEGVALWPPESMEGIPIVLSPNSTGEFVVQACLKSSKFNIEDVEFIYEQQPGVLEALTPDANGTTRANLGGLWAPNTYKFLDSVRGAQTLCSGASVYATVTGGHMARREFAEENPETIAKFLAAWLRAVNFTNSPENKEEVLNHMETFYKEHEVDIPRSSMELDLRLVGLFSLEQQLKLMERRGEPPISTYDIWTNEIANFMLANGVISELPNPATFIDDKYMKMVNDDPVLKSYAVGHQEGEATPSSAAGLQSVVGTLASSLAAGVFLLVQ